MNIFLKIVTYFRLETVAESRVSHRWVITEWVVYGWFCSYGHWAGQGRV